MRQCGEREGRKKMISRGRFFTGVFLLTSSTLMLELVETRILSVVAWYYLAFFVISVAMFGMTAGAVWVFLRRKNVTGKSMGVELTKATAAFALTTALSLAVQTTLTPVVLQTLTAIVTWVELAICLAIPFFFSGVAVSIALTKSTFPIGQVYGADMLGAGTGCLGALFLLTATDGPSAMLWVAATVALAAVMFDTEPTGGSLHRARCGGLLVVLVAVAFFNSFTSHGFEPVAIKGQTERSESKLFEKWNSFSRVGVYRVDSNRPEMFGPSPLAALDTWSVEQRRMNIDGEAGTVMYRFDGDRQSVDFLRYDITNLAYYLPGKRVGAVIGVGGGRDVLSAWVFGLQKITGVEINPIFIRLLSDESGYADFANINKLGGVCLEEGEARSWFARTDQQFDLIQMSLIDTWAATGAGAFSLTENGLYTVEGWRVFVRRLSRTGVFTVSRWYAPGAVNETGRLVSLATATLLEQGVAEPRRHIYLAATGRVATLVLSHAPFSASDLEALEGAARRLGYDVLISPGAAVKSEVLRRIVEARDLEELLQYTSHLPLNLEPPTDNRPFFFNQLPLNRPVQVLRMAFSLTRGQLVPGVVQGNLMATATLLLLFLVSVVGVLATVVAPVTFAVRDVSRRLVCAGTVYFAFIGVGFMMIEIAFLQLMSVFLGHPSYSLTVVLFTLIMATGAGSLLSERLVIRTKLRTWAWGVLTGGYVLAAPLWLPATLGLYEGAELGVRAVVCILSIAPAGLLMGFGFPLGMRLTTVIDPKPGPWFWGINGAFGVLAASGAVISSMAFGINTTLALGGACYLGALPAALVLQKLLGRS